MKKITLMISLMPLLVLSAVFPLLQAQEIPAIVSSGWLEDNMDDPDLIILDVRDSNSYAAGHIPGSINVPAYPNWYINNPGEQAPWMELPEDEKLYASIANAGISTNSIVLIVARTSDSGMGDQGAYGMTKACRAAITLIYAGIENVIFLNGGYDKWEAEKKAVSAEAALPQATAYIGKVNTSTFIDKAYVERKLGKSTIIDTRDCDTYFGLESDYSSSRAGHIPTAKVLPAPWFWEYVMPQEGAKGYMVWKDDDVILEIARTVLGGDLDQEIIDYCGVGGFASPVWFVLTQVAGYRNVKFYDGSMQEWTADPEAAVVKYKYQ